MFNKNSEDVIEIYIFLILWNLFSSNKEGGKSAIEKKFNRNLSLILPINDKKNIHLHHWLYLILMLKKCKKKK